MVAVLLALAIAQASPDSKPDELPPMWQDILKNCDKKRAKLKDDIAEAKAILRDVPKRKYRDGKARASAVRKSTEGVKAAEQKLKTYEEFPLGYFYVDRPTVGETGMQAGVEMKVLEILDGESAVVEGFLFFRMSSGSGPKIIKEPVATTGRFLSSGRTPSGSAPVRTKASFVYRLDTKNLSVGDEVKAKGGTYISGEHEGMPILQPLSKEEVDKFAAYWKRHIKTAPKP